MTPRAPQAWSLGRILVFWWIAFLLIQQAERVFLLPDAVAFEEPTWAVLGYTAFIGLRADVIVSTVAVGLALALALALWVPLALGWREPVWPLRLEAYSRLVAGASMLIGSVVMIVLFTDMGYYGYNHRRLDFVFFEFLDDLLAGPRRAPSQATLQTQAELGEAGKWGARVATFLGLQAAVLLAWWQAFERLVAPHLSRLREAAPRAAHALLIGGLVGGLLGFHPYGPWSVQRAGIRSSTFYTLAQNPVWYGGEVLLATFASGLSGTVRDLLQVMTLDEAVAHSRAALGGGGRFPDSRYPLVRTVEAGPRMALPRPANVLLLFIEGLDRRYLGRHLDPSNGTDFGRWFIYETPHFQGSPARGEGDRRTIAVTPFLDRLRRDSLYFEHFFSNGTQSARGLFATLCSQYPRQGAAVMKTRYTLDFLCLPSLLQRAGYQTEIVVGQNRDRNYDHLGLFLARNGMQRMLDESDFPAGAERLGLGVTDGALFAFLRTRIETLRRADRPYFLTTLTVGTHHPYETPGRHPDVRGLQRHADRYVAALRELDLELERFFADLRREGLLENTVVLILGDHGRHHGSGRTETERWAGHFTTPLFMWLDPSLREALPYRPRTVSVVASQVDVAPTILGLNGLAPRVTSFLGTDLSCLLAGDCLDGQFAFLTSAYDDVVGLADHSGVWFYSLRDKEMYHNTLAFNGPATPRPPTDPAVRPVYERLLALYVSANVLLEENRIWSWKELEGAL